MLEMAKGFVSAKLTHQRALLQRHNREAPQPEIAQVVEIGVVNEHTQTERAVVDRQRWRWDKQAKRWWLMTGLPAIARGPRGIN